MKNLVIVVVLLMLCGVAGASDVSGVTDAAWQRVFRFQSKLAEQGNPVAQFKLGEMYEQGLAVDRDLDVAKSWYQKAAAQGHEPAQQRLDALARPAAAAASADEARAREQARREAEARQKAMQEAAAREQAAREQAAKERAAREKAARDKAAREKAARERAARDKAAREKAARERAARERAQREAAAAEKARQEALAREQAQREAPVQAEAAAAPPAVQANEPAPQSAPEESADQEGTAFKVDPCEGPAARFMSNCR
ncbi:MAG: SEL1-like repeat protein [Chromatiales bacterium]|jgi:DNA polymerase III gamma/tau subunit